MAEIYVKEFSSMHRFIKKILFLILFPVMIHAQQNDLKFERILAEEGAPQGINCIVQDNK